MKSVLLTIFGVAIASGFAAGPLYANEAAAVDSDITAPADTQDVVDADTATAAEDGVASPTADAASTSDASPAEPVASAAGSDSEDSSTAPETAVATTDESPGGMLAGTVAVNTSISSEVGFTSRSYAVADTPVSPMMTTFSGGATEKPKPNICITVPTGPVAGEMRVTVGGSSVTTLGEKGADDPQAAKTIQSAAAVIIHRIGGTLIETIILCK